MASDDVMSVNEGPTNPFLDQRFCSYDELQKFMKSLESQTKQKFSIIDSRTVQAAKNRVKRHLKEDLMYYTITYACIHGGGQFRSKGKGIRKSSTYKMGCPFKVRFMASKDGNYLESVTCCCKHEGHELSEKVYEHLPQVRKLNDDQTEEIENYFEVGGNTKRVQNKVILEQGKKVTLKDVNNIKYRLKQEEGDDLQDAIKILKEDYKADVAVLKDTDSNFKALYFSTEHMRRSMASFPEIVFIDGTYKLLNNGLTVILLVQDSNGLSEVVCVCLLQDEDYDTLKWFLKKFKSENEIASTSIRCFMGDKDLLERNVLKEVFENIPVYISLFQTLKTFRRELTSDKFNMNKSEKETCLELLSKLAYSNSEQAYEKIYRVFTDTCPPDVVHYYNQNWHKIRSEWTCHTMNQGNLNYRLESLNQKIKAVVPLNSSLCIFLKHFLIWLRSHNEERNSKVAQLILKRPITKHGENSFEKKYFDFLTPYAYSHVLHQYKLSKKVTITEGNGIFKAKDKNKNITVNAITCECSVFLSMLLPCRHILSLRRYLKLSLFCEEACNKRWRKSVYLTNHRIMLGESSRDSIPLSCTVTNLKKPKVFNPMEKRKRANLIANSLVDLATISDNSQFQYKLDCLTKIEELWRQGYDVNISKINSTSENLNIGKTEIIEDQSNTIYDPEGSQQILPWVIIIDHENDSVLVEEFHLENPIKGPSPIFFHEVIYETDISLNEEEISEADSQDPLLKEISKIIVD